jgi:hypothetical protein
MPRRPNDANWSPTKTDTNTGRSENATASETIPNTIAATTNRHGRRRRRSAAFQKTFFIEVRTTRVYDEAACQTPSDIRPTKSFSRYAFGYTQQGQQSAIELRGAEPPEDAEIDDIWIAGHPFGFMIQNAKNRDKLFRNVLLLLAGWDRDIVEDNTGTDFPDGAPYDCENAANGNTTSGTVTADPEQLVPIHRKTKVRKTETHNLSGNKYRATFVWQAFHARAVKEQGK